MRIDRGHFGDTRLDGITWAGLFAWPGAIHEGHGEALAVIDDHATAAQRQAILTILSGAESEPGATHFQVFSSMIDKFHDPLFKPIDFELDLERGTGRFAVPDLIEAKGEPIRNPMTGKPHRNRVRFPGGFEFTEAEFGSSNVKADGPVPLDWLDRHAHFAVIDIGPMGPAR
jgi:hypothetical protein